MAPEDTKDGLYYNNLRNISVKKETDPPDLDRIKNEDFKTNYKFHIRPCYVVLRRNLILEDYISSRRLKKLLNLKLTNSGDSDPNPIPSNNNPDISKISSANESGKYSAGNDASMARNINSEKKPPEHFFGYNYPSTSETRIVKCMFRKISPIEYNCNECERTFTRKAFLIRHFRIIHSGENPFKCNNCGKTFSGRGSLDTHVRIHTGEKPFKCTECEKSFTKVNNLNRHFQTIHSGENPFKCKKCGKTFPSRWHVNNHKRIHTGEKPFKCTECEKSFNQKANLKIHLRIHTGEKPYKCEECEKSFTQKTNLDVHLRYHSGEKPYKCDKCEETFAQLSTLQGHFRRHR